MRTLHHVLLAGVAVVAIGLPGAASAQSADSHVMTVRMPGGGVTQIYYTGNVAPQVRVGEAAAPIAVVVPMGSPFGAESPFAMMERISAEMDRRAAAMLRQADAVAAQARSGQPAGQLTEAAAGNLPPGSQSYSFISTLSGSGVCTRSVEITSQGNGAPPKIVSHSAGNCAATPDAGGTGSVNLPAAPAPANRPDVVWTSAHGAHSYSGLVREIPPAQR